MRAHMNGVIQYICIVKNNSTDQLHKQAAWPSRLDTLYTDSFNSEISRLYPTKIKVNMQDFELMNIQVQPSHIKDTFWIA